MKKSATIQDIANELELSRNTVSKAINNTGFVSPETKDKIFKKAAELGYKQFNMLKSADNIEKPAKNREIALFTCSIPSSQHLSAVLLDTFEKKFTLLGYRLVIYLLRRDTVSSCMLPESFRKEFTDAILVMELFDKPYTDFLCTQEIPTLFIDSYANCHNEIIKSDLLYIECRNSVYQLISHMVYSDCKNIGYVGDHLHCQSFYERWCGFKNAMEDHTDTNYQALSILEDDSSPYHDPLWLSEKIRLLPFLPDAFFCANDYIAICTIKALKLLNYSLPNDIKVAGFDNSYESQIVDPALTTVAIYGLQMGYIATNILLNRIKYPDAPYTSTYVQTEVIYRDSTEPRS